MERRIEENPWIIPSNYRSGWFFLFGAALIVLGVLAILLPFTASLTTVLAIGWILLIGGVVQIVHSIQHRAAPGLAWALLTALLRLIAGVFLIANPIPGRLIVTATLAAYLVVMGVVEIAHGVDLRGAPHRGWIIMDGVVSLALGILLWVGFPVSATWVIGLFVGIEMILAGFAVVALGVTMGTRRAGAA
jgi:uncharacterized membrane protein HdeD (DUF308 family)